MFEGAPSSASKLFPNISVLLTSWRLENCATSNQWSLEASYRISAWRDWGVPWENEKYSSCPWRDSNQALLQYNWRALPVEPSCPVISFGNFLSNIRILFMYIPCLGPYSSDSCNYPNTNPCTQVSPEEAFCTIDTLPSWTLKHQTHTHTHLETLRQSPECWHCGHFAWAWRPYRPLI